VSEGKLILLAAVARLKTEVLLLFRVAMLLLLLAVLALSTEVWELL
jgi:hypothetical protein